MVGGGRVIFPKEQNASLFLYYGHLQTSDLPKVGTKILRGRPITAVIWWLVCTSSVATHVC